MARRPLHKNPIGQVVVERTTDRATVAIAQCDSYDLDDVRRAVRQVVDLLGGMSAFVVEGQSLLLKPNMLSAKAPERAITTHPTVIQAIVELARESGAEPRMGDSPGGAIRGVERVWQNSGFLDLSERTGVELVNFEKEGAESVEGELSSYMITRPVLDADVIINVPKMKTHVLTLYTGCIKNMFGSIPGFGKGRMHNTAPRPEHFSRHLVDVFSLVRPALNVVDAVFAMEGDGPSGGKPRFVGAILAGTDAVAIDTILAGMMGIKDGQVHMIRQAAERGLGITDRRRIDILGVAPESFDTSGFELPSAGVLNYIPGFLVRALKPWIWVYPEMSKEWGCRAEECALCVRSCPVDAIRMTETGPVVDRKACVECLCCHEVCPHEAVRVKLSWLAGKFA